MKMFKSPLKCFGRLGGVLLYLMIVSTGAQANSQSDTFNQALKWSQENQCHKALPIWQSLSKKFPQSLAIANNYAACLMAMGQYAKAEAYLKKAIQAEATRATAWENLNKLYAYQAQQAYQNVYNKVIKTQPQPHFVLRIDSLDENSQNKGTTPAEAQVLQALEQWRSAWSHQQVVDYLAAYATNFRPEDGQSKSQWQQQRKIRILRPKYIHLSLSSLSARQLSPKLVWVSAEQTYQSNSYRDRTLKAWLWYKEKGYWRILKEMVLPNE